MTVFDYVCLGLAGLWFMAGFILLLVSPSVYRASLLNSNWFINLVVYPLTLILIVIYRQFG